MLKIGFDAKRAFLNFRGLGNYSRSLLSGIDKYYNQDIKIYLFTPSDKNLFEKWHKDLKNQITITPSNFFSKIFSGLWRTFGISSFLFKNKLDIYHGLSHELPLFNRSKCKKIVTIHDLIFKKRPEGFSFFDRIIYNFKFKNSCVNSDFIISTSIQTKNDIIDYYKINPEKITVLYQSCSEYYYQLIPEEFRKQRIQKLDLDDKNYILYLGAFESNKNIDGIVRGYAECKTKKTCKLVLAGRGNQKYLSKIKCLIEQLKLEDRVRILLSPDDQSLPLLFQAAKMFIFPSFFEGFGIPIIQAQFSHIPVITTDDLVFKESAGPHSIFVNPYSYQEIADAIDKINSDTALREFMIESGKNYVQKFHIKNTTKELVDYYQRVIRM